MEVPENGFVVEFVHLVLLAGSPTHTKASVLPNTRPPCNQISLRAATSRASTQCQTSAKRTRGCGATTSSDEKSSGFHMLKPTHKEAQVVGTDSRFKLCVLHPAHSANTKTLAVSTRFSQWSKGVRSVCCKFRRNARQHDNPSSKSLQCCCSE